MYLKNRDISFTERRHRSHYCPAGLNQRVPQFCMVLPAFEESPRADFCPQLRISIFAGLWYRLIASIRNPTRFFWRINKSDGNTGFNSGPGKRNGYQIRILRAKRIDWAARFMIASPDTTAQNYRWELPATKISCARSSRIIAITLLLRELKQLTGSTAVSVADFSPTDLTSPARQGQSATLLDGNDGASQ
jgi:hypothetical protein